MSLDSLSRSCYTEDHEAFRATVRRFVAEQLEPHAAKWDEDGIIPKDVWPKAGELGLLCPTVPESGLGDTQDGCPQPAASVTSRPTIATVRPARAARVSGLGCAMGCIAAVYT